MENNIIVIGSAGSGRSIGVNLPDNVVVFNSIEEVKERGIQMTQRESFVIEALPQLHCPIVFEERPNYITGKKLPKKKKR